MMSTSKNKKIKLILVFQAESLPLNLTPHFGLLCLAAYIKKYFPQFTIKVIESVEPLKEVISFKPDIVGITAASPDYESAKLLAKSIRKRFDCPIILGGVHISTCPESFTPFFDVGVVGEGEITFSELLKLYIKKKKFPKNDLKEIDGLVFLDHQKIVKTKPRQLIQDLDSLPYPARELINMEEDHLQNQANLHGVKRITVITTSRGCPFHCIYCASSAYWSKHRVNSVDHIIKEIDFVIKTYHVDGIIFWDDLFITPKSRVMELVREIKKRGWDKKIVFSSQVRADVFDDDIAKALKSINVKRLSFGFESYSPRMLNYLKGGSTSVQKNIDAIDLCHKYGIEVTSGLIVGAPGETIEDLKINYEVMKKHPMEGTSIYLLTAYPGTKTWALAAEKNIVNKDMDMRRLHTNIPLSACFKFWKKDRFYFLKDHIFLNQEKRYDNKYLSMILKLHLLATFQNHIFYFKHFLFNPKIVLTIIKTKLTR